MWYFTIGFIFYIALILVYIFASSLTDRLEDQKHWIHGFCLDNGAEWVAALVTGFVLVFLLWPVSIAIVCIRWLWYKCVKRLWNGWMDSLADKINGEADD